MRGLTRNPGDQGIHLQVMQVNNWQSVDQSWPKLLIMFKELTKLKVKLDNFVGLTLSLWCTVWLNSVIALCTLCPNSPVYAALLSDKWCCYELISSPCCDSPLSTTVFASHTVSRLKLELRWTGLLHCSFPCNHFVSVQIGLKKESNNKQNKAWAGANGYSGFSSQQV